MQRTTSPTSKRLVATDGAEVSRLRRISSKQNSLIKDLRRAFTQSEVTDDGFTAIESVKTIEEAIRSGLKFRAVVFSEAGLARAERLMSQIGPKVETVVVADEIFLSAVDTASPQGVAALVRMPEFTLDDCVGGKNPLVALLAGVQDPGNLGTVMRSAEAFGVSGIIAGEHTVSRLNAKAVRASAGSVFRMPFVKAHFGDVLPKLRKRGVRLVGTSSHKGKAIAEVDLNGSVALVIGNEGAGLSSELLAHLDEAVRIPQAAKVESLNVGVAASVMFYEAARQRMK